jgi:hypothetical protein
MEKVTKQFLLAEIDRLKQELLELQGEHETLKGYSIRLSDFVDPVDIVASGNSGGYAPGSRGIKL